MEIDDDEGLRLKRDNPKGRLLERCVTEGVPFPEFEVRPLAAGGFAGRARLRLERESTRESGLFRAAAAKTVEQAAARDLLLRPPARDPSAEDGRGEATPDPGPGPDPRLLLNRYRQTGQLVDFGYEVVGTGGPSHRPVFVVRGWADTRDGERLFSDPVTAPSKKEAQRRAAEAMVSRLRS